MTRARAITVETMLRKAAETRIEVLQAQHEATLDALACLVAAFPELERAHSTQEQQIALRVAHALLVSHGRRTW